MNIKFDDIHTNKKQRLLEEMMIKVSQELHQIDTGKVIKSLTCPVCNKSNISLFVHKYGFNMDKCADCGLLFCNPYPTDKQVHYYYNSEMKKFENEFFMESFEKRIQIFLPRIELIKKYKPRGALLDVGSSIGIFVEALNQSTHEFNITCCDISLDACQRLEAGYPDVEILNLDYRLLGDINKFDVITMWDTVEHIVDQNELFSSVRKILLLNGVFIFSTPNTNSFEWITAQENHVQILPPGHVNLMNIDNISILLDRYDFELLDHFTLNPSLDIDYVLKATRQEHIIPQNVGVFLDTMLTDIAFRGHFEDFLRDKKLAGNIVVVAKKLG
jgi:2-polyprenyl-3-methyl-5-hydroxy-6-metoxy-1,4-benzoquinol methylase